MKPKYIVKPAIRETLFGTRQHGYTIYKRFLFFWYRQFWIDSFWGWQRCFHADLQRVKDECERLNRDGEVFYI